MTETDYCLSAMLKGRLSLPYILILSLEKHKQSRLKLIYKPMSSNEPLKKCDKHKRSLLILFIKYNRMTFPLSQINK